MIYILATAIIYGEVKLFLGILSPYFSKIQQTLDVAESIWRRYLLYLFEEKEPELTTLKLIDIKYSHFRNLKEASWCDFESFFFVKGL